MSADPRIEAAARAQWEYESNEPWAHGLLDRPHGHLSTEHIGQDDHR